MLLLRYLSRYDTKILSKKINFDVYTEREMEEIP
jgi:hypothetical protein